MAREQQVCSAVDDREYELIRQAARACDQSMASFVRDASLAAAVETLKDGQDEEGEDDGPTG